MTEAAPPSLGADDEDIVKMKPKLEPHEENVGEFRRLCEEGNLSGVKNALMDVSKGIDINLATEVSAYDKNISSLFCNHLVL